MKGAKILDGPLFQPDLTKAPAGVDRRAFLMRAATIGAAAVLTDCTPEEKAKQVGGETPPPTAAAPALSDSLNVVKQSKGPVMTTIEEFYKVGPGPSSSHTIGPMRITYDFYQRCTKLPADQLAKATGVKVHLYGSLSATGKGHGTERASLAGIIGKEPATVDPMFLDNLKDNPDQTFPLKLGDKTIDVSLKDVIYEDPKKPVPHPNTMTCQLVNGDAVVYEQEYYSVGGGFIEWKGYEPPKKGQPKYPYSTMKELVDYAEQNKLSIAQIVMANEVAVSGKTEAEVNAYADKILNAMVATVNAGLKAPGRSAGPDKTQDQGRRGLQAGDAGPVSERAGTRRNLGVRPGRFGRKRARSSRHHGPHRRIRGRPSRSGLRLGRGRPQVTKEEDPGGPAGRRRGWLPLQTQRHPRRGGRRLPGGNWRCVCHGCCADRSGERLPPSGCGQCC